MKFYEDFEEKKGSYLKSEVLFAKIDRLFEMFQNEGQFRFHETKL